MGLFKTVAGTILGLGMTYLGAPNWALAQDLNQVQIQTVPVAQGVYMLLGEGGNIGASVGPEGVFLIDDQFAPLTAKIQAAVKELSDQPIRFLVNTHWHFDHTGGNENLGKAGVVIVAHDQVRERMKVDNVVEFLQRQIPAAPPVALPVITFNDQVTFHFNGQTIQAFHVDAAHTDGDTVLYFQEADVIHAGDIYFNGLYPFIDQSSGGNIDGVIAAVDRILSLAGDQTKIIPGHGSLSNRAELVAYRQMLVDVRDRTQKAIQAGLSLEDFIAARPMADYDKAWGKGFLKPEQFITLVYQLLSAQP